VDSHARLHAELTGFLRQHCPVCDERHLVLLGWMVVGLLLSQTVCFDQWKRSVPLNRSLPASWQRRCRRWVSLAGERRRVDPYWKRGLSFARIGLHWIQQSVITAGRALLAWIPIPLQALEPCIPSLGVRRRQKRPWFARIELPPLSRQTAPLAIA